MTPQPSPDDGPRLLLLDGPSPRAIGLGAGPIWTLGRSPENGIVIEDTSISRKHAMLQRLGREIFLVDLGSANGTFVNGRRVSVPITLRSGDRVAFGSTRCEFVIPMAPAPGDEDDAPEAPELATHILQIRSLVTVMVVDVRGFTALTRQVSDQTLSGVMSHWFEEASRITHRSGGWVDKYIGDAIMALWSHDDRHGVANPAAHWLRALSEIARMTARAGDGFPMPSPLRVGAGVNTGFAVVGTTGSRDRPDYTALGDTVNTAFALEAATRPLGCDVLVGESSWETLRQAGAADAFVGASVRLKGRDEPVTAYAADFAAIMDSSARLGPASGIP
jgi:adenylate cyclase